MLDTLKRYAALVRGSTLVICLVAHQLYATTFEFSMDGAPLGGGAVGTCVYAPTKTEKPFYEWLSEAGQSTFEGNLGKKQHFTLSGHDGQFVSWLGIVRGRTPAAAGSGASLLIQNTYFEGLTDCHIQTVEIFGAGDFEAQLSELPEDLIPLVLVRVYGTVHGQHEKRPIIKADYVRVWHFGQFNFMKFGVDHSNPKWIKKIQVPPDKIYAFWGSKDYYERRLGPTSEEWDEIAAFHRGQTEMDFEYEDMGDDSFKSYASYKPNEWEERYFTRLPNDERTTTQSKPGEQEHTNFHLTGHLHQFVSWFGIVREVTPNVGRRGGVLLIENKYDHGLGDEKLQTVSIRGGGNFKAEMTNLSAELVPPMLVRVYGSILREEGNLPVMEVAYLRGWHIGQFNFQDYGEDHSDPRWIPKVSLAAGEDVHQSNVSADYYIKLLGPTEEQANRIRENLRWKRQQDDKRKMEQSESDNKRPPVKP